MGVPDSTIISLVPKDPNPCQKHFCTPKGTLLPDSLLLGCRSPQVRRNATRQASLIKAESVGVRPYEEPQRNTTPRP